MKKMLNAKQTQNTKPENQNFRIDPRIDRLIRQFNTDEEHWRRLEGLRRLIREMFPEHSDEEIERLELSLFARTRPPEDCVGWRMTPAGSRTPAAISSFHLKWRIHEKPCNSAPASPCVSRV